MRYPGSHGAVRVITVAGERGSYDVVVAGGALTRLGELVDQRVSADEVREVLAQLTDGGWGPLESLRCPWNASVPLPVSVPVSASDGYASNRENPSGTGTEAEAGGGAVDAEVPPSCHRGEKR